MTGVDVIAAEVMRMAMGKCQMIKAHHPDCECQLCMAQLDEQCAAPAVAVLLDGRRAIGRICDECAVAMHLEGDYAVKRDDGRPVMSS
jgi:hypothetical protein